MTNLNYTFSSKTKNITYGLMAIGLITMIAGYLTDTAPTGEGAGEEYHHTRFWANVLVNGWFFMGIGLLATFMIALEYVAEVAWSVAVKRVIEGVSSFLPVGAIIMVLILLAGQLHVHHLYHWMDPEVYKEFLEDGKPNPKYDAIIAGKHGYFTPWFFWLRTIAYVVVWCWFQRIFLKASVEQDLQGGTAIHYKQIGKAAVFMVFFAVTSSTVSWDWMMSLDVHWFSTIYGWYSFAGMWISSLTAIILLVLYLKRKGYLEQVNDSHIHDIAKWVFAVSFLWSYLWFAQFMLIWYTDIPEEIIYFQERLHDFHYMGLMWTVLFMNFVFPMILLMSRDAKRNYFFLTFVGCIIFVGHWLDVYMMVMPATVKGAHKLGWLEIGMALGFLGLLLFIVHSALAKRPLMVQKHPYLEESLHHQC